MSKQSPVAYIVRHVGAANLLIAVALMFGLALAESYFIKMYFEVADLVKEYGAEIFFDQHRYELLLLIFTYVVRFILALLVAYVVVRLTYGFAENLSIKAVSQSLSKGIWSDIGDRSGIFVTPEILATKALKPILFTIVETMTLAMLIAVIINQSYEAFFVFIGSFVTFILLFYYLPSLLLKDFGAIREAAESESQERINQVLDAPLDFLSTSRSRRYLDQVSTIVGKKYSAIRSYNILTSMLRYILEACFLLSIVISGFFLATGLDFSIGDVIVTLTGFIIAGARIVPSISRLAQARVDFNFGLPSLKKVIQHDVTRPQTDQCISTLSTKSLVRIIHHGRIYPTNALVPEDIELAEGKVVAIVGDIGSGKTALLKNLMFPRGEGYVRVNIPNDEYNDNIIYSSPKPFLVPCGIAENVYLRHESELTKLELYNLNKALVDLSLDSSVVSTSTNLISARLSSGSRQIVGVLRALFSEAPIVFLDEPTSALDPQLEQSVCDFLQSRIRNKVVVMVTHRALPLSIADVTYEFIKSQGQFRLTVRS